MPLAGPVFSGLIYKQFLDKKFKGTKALTLANAIGNGVVMNILSTNLYSGQGVGIGVGVGSGTGSIKGIVGPVVGLSIYGQMLSKGLKGTKALNLAMAIGSAFATHIKSGMVTSVCAGLANGVGIGTLKGVTGAAMGTMINTMMMAQGIKGTKAAVLASAIGNGIANILKMGIITTTIKGAGYPPSPSSGKDTGKMM